MNGFGRVVDAPDVGAARHGVIHSRAADLLADQFHDHRVDLRERQARQHGLGQFQQAFVGGVKVLGLDRLDRDDVVMRVLDRRQPAREGTVVQQHAADLRQHGAEPHRRAQAMHAVGAPRLAEPDGNHLDQAAFDGPVEAGVRLDPADGDDAVRTGRVGIQQAGQAFIRAAQFDHLHGRANRHAHGGLRYAETLQNPRLAFGGGAAVAAHGGHDERLQAPFLEIADDARDQTRQLGQASAADADGHRGAGGKCVDLPGARQRGADRAIQVGHRRALRLRQAHPHQGRRHDGIEHGDTDFGKNRAFHWTGSSRPKRR